ncbi:MAG TPA: hypothetical protein VFI24_07770 [Pyrinomonadaceae bacterium]|nr:hypothetical protein [Pyrinomonadaceae bacterium]
MATRKQSGVKNVSSRPLTLADTYGLGLIVHGDGVLDKSEIFAHLSANAKKIARSVNPEKKSKTAAKRRAAKR